MKNARKYSMACLEQGQPLKFFNFQALDLRDCEQRVQDGATIEFDHVSREKGRTTIAFREATEADRIIGAVSTTCLHKHGEAIMGKLRAPRNHGGAVAITRKGKQTGFVLAVKESGPR